MFNDKNDVVTTNILHVAVRMLMIMIMMMMMMMMTMMIMMIMMMMSAIVISMITMMTICSRTNPDICVLHVKTNKITATVP